MDIHYLCYQAYMTSSITMATGDGVLAEIGFKQAKI